jgi:hypothetical protein
MCKCIECNTVLEEDEKEYGFCSSTCHEEYAGLSNYYIRDLGDQDEDITH